MSNEDQPGLSPEEFARVLAELQRLRSPEHARRREIIRTVRTNWPTLGAAIFALTKTARNSVGDGQSRTETATYVAATSAGSIMVRESSPAAEERNANRHPTVNPNNGRVIAALTTQFAAVLDHLDGLGILLAANGPIRPAFAASRAVLLSGVRTSWIADPALADSIRVVRVVNLELKHLQEAAQDLRGDTGETEPSGRAEIADLEGQLLADGDADGLARKDRSKRFLPADGSDEAMAEAVAPGLGRNVWRTLSSSAHAMDRGPYAALALNQIVELDDDRDRRAYAAGGIYSAVVMAFKGIEAAAQYLGGNTELLNQLLEPFDAMWQRGTMSSAGEIQNGIIADAIIAAS